MMLLLSANCYLHLDCAPIHIKDSLSPKNQHCFLRFTFSSTRVKMLRVLCLSLLVLVTHAATVRKQLVREVLPGIGSYYFHPVALNWTDAATYCRITRRGNLAFPNSADEASLLSTMMKAYKAQYIHVGFHDQFKEGEYYTVTGDRVSQACFKTWYTQTGSADRNCGAFRDYPGLLDIPCSTKYPFICIDYNFFRDDFDYIRGYGYYKMHRALRTWITAQRTCESEGANLVVINSEGELNALSSRYGHFESWVGLHHVHVNWQVISIFDEPLYTTGFERWESGQPSGTNDIKPYLKVNSAPDFGLALSSGTDVFSFICEYRQADSTPPPTYSQVKN